MRNMMLEHNQKRILGYLLVQRVILFLAVYAYLNRQLQETSSDETSGNPSYEDYECTGCICTKYILSASADSPWRTRSSRIASQTSSKTYFYHTDHLGSASVITDERGNWVEKIYYYPYGEVRSRTGSDVTKYKYTGQEEDPETGLYYYGARYYDPVIGRFISADIIVQAPFDPQTLNRYSYCLNNPLIYTDPTGHFVFGKFLKSLFSGFVGGVVFALTGNPVFAGMAAGAVAGALDGGLRGAFIGAVTGGLLGGVGWELYKINPYLAYGMLAGGAAYATAKGGLNGLAYYAGGVLGGMAGYAGAKYAMGTGNEASNMGGGKCERCMGPNDKPPYDLSKLNYRDFFEDKSYINSGYGTRKDPFSGLPADHGGWDQVGSTLGYDTEVLAPRAGSIFRVTDTGIFYRPSDWPGACCLNLQHTSFAWDASLPLSVNKGDVMSYLAPLGDSTGAHLHIQLECGGKVYNPKYGLQ